MPLTDVAIRNIKPGEKKIRYADSLGLYLEVLPAGGRYFRWKYRYAGKEKRLALGVYPEVSLRDARNARDEARRQLAQGFDPVAERKHAKLSAVQRSTNTFEIVAREWMSKKELSWAGSTAEKVRNRLENYVYPQIGTRPIASITPPELLAVIRRVEAKTIETAHRLLRNCGQIFRYGIATGRCERDTAADLKGSLAAAPKRHFAATLEPRRLGRILRHMDMYEGTPTVRAALRLAPLLFVRPGELRHAKWADFDFDQAQWRYYVTKTKTWHLVPLARQVLDILKPLQELTSDSEFVFPGGRSLKRPMSENAVLNALRTLEISKEEMTGHGFRAVARTLLDEDLKFRPEIIEHQLAHTVRDPLGRAYNRTTHLQERTRMMQDWADYLDLLKERSKLEGVSKREV